MGGDSNRKSLLVKKRYVFGGCIVTALLGLAVYQYDDARQGSTGRGDGTITLTTKSYNTLLEKIDKQNAELIEVKAAALQTVNNLQQKLTTQSSHDTTGTPLQTHPNSLTQKDELPVAKHEESGESAGAVRGTHDTTEPSVSNSSTSVNVNVTVRTEAPTPVPPPNSDGKVVCVLNKFGKAVGSSRCPVDTFGQEIDSCEPNGEEVSWVLPNTELTKHCASSVDSAHDNFTVPKCMVCPEFRKWNMNQFEEAGHDGHLFDTVFNYLKPTSIVVDVGGYTGEAVRELNNRYQPTFHIFEPMEMALEKLNANLKQLSGNFNVHPFGLGEKNKVAYLYIPGGGDSAYMFDQPGPDRERIQIQEAAPAINKLVLRSDTSLSVTLLHINCEGCEWEVLESLRTVYSRFEHIAIQWHGNSRQPNRMQRWCQIRGNLTKTHKLTFWANWVWEHWERKE